MFLPHRFLQGSTRITLIHSDFFFVKSFKMDIGQLFWCDVDIVVKQCVKVLFGYICSICMCTKRIPKLWMLSEKSKNFWQKCDQNQSEQNQNEWNQSEGNQSKPNQSKPNQSNWNFLKPPRAPWSYSFCILWVEGLALASNTETCQARHAFRDTPYDGPSENLALEPPEPPGRLKNHLSSCRRRRSGSSGSSFSLPSLFSGDTLMFVVHLRPGLPEGREAEFRRDASSSWHVGADASKMRPQPATF